MNVEFVPENDENDVLLSIDLPSPPAKGDTITLSVEREKDKDFLIVGVHWVPIYLSGRRVMETGVICTVRKCDGE